MFGNKQTGIKGGALSVIGAGVTVTGDIATDGDLHVDGVVAGDIACGTLVQGPQSRIAGTIRATTARLAGTVEGEVRVTALTLEPTARIHGDSSYETLSIAAGAQVDGRMAHIAAAAPEPPLRLVDSSDTSS